jgi:IclR family mhp operon transcriptional activator
MRHLTGAPYKRVEGLSRGLAVLRALNRAMSGQATAGQLSQQTGLHRTTVRRLLETLLSEGYVRRSSSDDSYRLALKVRELSEGFTDDEWIAEIANPALGELLRKVVWPSDLATLDGDALVVRESTHRFSPLSVHRNLVGRRMPLLYTALGRAYLAFCGDDERELLLRLLIAKNDEQARLARDTRFVKALVEKVRADGVATNDGEWKEESHIAAIALPICHADRILGSLNVVYLKRAMTIKDAIARYLPALRATISKIETQCAARGTEGAPVREPKALR